MKLKNFNDFLNESTPLTDSVEIWKKHFLETVMKDLEEGAITWGSSGGYDSVKLDNVDNVHNVITVSNTNVIDSDKQYSIMGVSRPTINMDYKITMRFTFNDKKIKAFNSPSAKYGLVEVKFGDLFKMEVSNVLKVTIDEIEDFQHIEGDAELSETDIAQGFDSTEEFAEDFHMQVDHWIEELCPPIPGKNMIRGWLDQYEKNLK